MTFLAVLLIIAMIATLAALVYGVVMFLKTSSDAVHNGDGPSTASVKSNKAMQYRIIFQGVAILIVIAIMALSAMSKS